MFNLNILQSDLRVRLILFIYLRPRCNQCIQFNWKSPNLQSGELQTINKVLDNQHFNKALRGIVSSELKTNNDLCL